MTHDTPPEPRMPDRVECRAAPDPCARMFIVALLLLGYGLYAAYDVFVAKDAEGGPKYSTEKDLPLYAFNVALLALVPAGGIGLAWGVIMVRRRLVADQDGIGFAGREKVAWARIHRIVMRGKGLLDLHYKDPDGEEGGVLRLDSWKLRNFADLVALVEAKTPQAPVEIARK